MTQERILKEEIILKSYHVQFPPKPIVSNECKEFIKKCLTYNFEDRWEINNALNSSYFQKI